MELFIHYLSTMKNCFASCKVSHVKYLFSRYQQKFNQIALYLNNLKQNIVMQKSRLCIANEIQKSFYTATQNDTSFISCKLLCDISHKRMLERKLPKYRLHGQFPIHSKLEENAGIDRNAVKPFVVNNAPLLSCHCYGLL